MTSHTPGRGSTRAVLRGLGPARWAYGGAVGGHSTSPNQAVEPTPNSLRSYVAPAIGRGLPRAFGCRRLRLNTMDKKRKKLFICLTAITTVNKERFPLTHDDREARIP
jgi:hypothetical protein